VGIQDIIEGKRQLRAHMARVRALLPHYQIVYKEIQRYLFKVGPVDVADGRLLNDPPGPTRALLNYPGNASSR
jgi:DNA-binding ferritin-like protein (Dps family)